MKTMTKSIALLVAFSLLFASNASARTKAVARNDEPSRTEKVLGALAVGAIAGIAYYALKGDDHRYRSYRGSHYRDHRYRSGRQHYGYRDYRRSNWSGYIAFSNGFTSLMIGSPSCNSYQPSRGYWYRSGGYNFYRSPYRYNNRYCRAFNAGWERGYWAGYLQGRYDARNRGQCRQYYNHSGGTYWGYQQQYGSYQNYCQAFDSAYSAGYGHAYYGHQYGSQNFGQGQYYGGHQGYGY